MNWLAVRVQSIEAHRAAALDALFGAGSRAVEEVGDELRTFVPIGTDAVALANSVTAASPGALIELSEVLVPEWDSAWRNGLSVQRVGKLTVSPPWLADSLDVASTVIVEPGMAFGTGDHATTRGVLRLMSAVVRPGDRVADLGAGSAVLAIGAAKLGAASVAAIEIDPDAIGNAEANVRINAVTDRVTVIEGNAAALLSLVAPVRVVLANIVAPVLVSLLPAIQASLTADGRAIVGGVVEDERADFARALAAAGWRVEAEDSEGSWWSAVIARR